MTRSGWSRREFTALSAATVGALLTGRSGRGVEEAAMTDRYEFLVGNVEAEYRIPTLVRFTDTSGFDTLAALDTEFRTHPEEPVAHAGFTPGQAETVAGANTTEQLEYAPGSNPFWPLGDYEAGVFPDPGDSVGFVALEEAVAGLEHLAAEHPDRLRVETVGTGHGHRNRYTGEQDPQPVWVAELTENVEAAEGRETVAFVASVHGDERAGVEASLRFVEDVLTGARPGVADRLSERRLVFICPNPDGWVADERLYEDPVDPPDFHRFNGADRDLNREQPSPGWIRPNRLPGEPRGANLVDDAPGPDEDVPDQVAEAVPETLSLVERLRSYDDVAYLVDLHGMYGHTNAVLAIETGGGTPADRADSDLLTRAIRARVQADVGPLANWSDAFEAAAADSAEQVGDPENCEPELLCEQPVELFGSGTGLDTIQYTVSGGLAGWAGAPERLGGLGATPLTLEVVFSNSLRQGDGAAVHARYRRVPGACLRGRLCGDGRPRGRRGRRHRRDGWPFDRLPRRGRPSPAGERPPARRGRGHAGRRWGNGRAGRRDDRRRVRTEAVRFDTRNRQPPARRGRCRGDCRCPTGDTHTHRGVTGGGQPGHRGDTVRYCGNRRRGYSGAGRGYGPDGTDRARPRPR
ncbi:MAG: hypothetical protein J07HX64_02403 [halophilic archaeon J07HX64]|nr:MAG: hypothetical protein J07HX64_02403 [halophilic archaeon J07HX64]